MGKFLVFGIVGVLVAAGCGGSGTGLRPAVTKDQILSSLGLFDNVARQGNVGPRAATSKSNLKFVKAARFLAPRSRVTRGDSEVLFDENYQLWYVEFMDGDTGGDHTWGRHYYQDQGLTQPAGEDSIHSVWNTSPETDDETIDITAGPFAGLHIEDHDSLDSAGNGRQWGSGNVPGQPDYAYTMEWPDGGYATVDEKFTAADGTWTRFQNGPENDGSHYVVTTSQATRMDLHFGANYDGTGTITGLGGLLPATLEWDTAGVGVIHWNDGTQTAFENWSIFS